MDIVGSTFLSLESAGDIVMDARKSWFAQEDDGEGEKDKDGSSFVV
jgi:hypothetical protein